MTDALKIEAKDLAAIRHRSVDAVDAAMRYLSGRTLGEGETICIKLTSTVQRNDQGNLYFGPMEGIANHV